MINANELRIGNLVFFNDQFIPIYEVKNNSVSFYLGLDHKERIRYQSIYLKGIEAIPITDEWLLNFGFENMEKFPLRYVQRIKPDSLSEFEPCIVIGDLWLTGIRYVHQLQNLYFALTGEEINYNII